MPAVRLKRRRLGRRLSISAIPAARAGLTRHRDRSMLRTALWGAWMMIEWTHFSKWRAPR